MRAAQHERINPLLDQGFEVTRNDSIRDRIIQPSFFDQRDKERTGLAGHFEGGIERLQGSFVSAALHGRASADDSDMTVASGGDGGLGTGTNYTDDRDWTGLFQFRQGHGRGGVAGHDDDFRIPFHEHPGDFDTVTFDRARAFAAIGNTRGVAQVNDALGGQQVAQRFDHGEAPNAGVKDADGAGSGCLVWLRHAFLFTAAD